MTKKTNISVVIPTVGENELFKVVKKLNSSNMIPGEIIISIFNKNFFLIKDKFQKYKNIKIIKTNLPGQVYQRLKGFQKAKFNFVLQLDADCLIDMRSILLLLKKIKSIKNAAVAPVFVDKQTMKPIHQINIKENMLDKFKSFILGFPAGLNKMGKVSKSGTNFGVDFRLLKKSSIDTDWLAGGCILHRKKDLYLVNYFPFKGKAFCEDLIHSFFLKKKKRRLIVLKKAKCFTTFPVFPQKLFEFLLFIRAYRFCSLLYNINFFRKYIIIFIYTFRFFIKKIKIL